MISIITPTYNRAHLIPRMINSVLGQTFNDWELLIMDDGSTDTTEDVVKKFDDHRIKYCKGINTGASQKRNDGVNLASGKYIIFLDSDDEVYPNWLEEFSKNLNEAENLVISCAWEKVDHFGRTVQSGYPKKLGNIFENMTINFLAGTLLLKKDYFQEAGGYDIQLSSGQHTELLMRLVPVFKKYDAKIIPINEVLVKIHLHQGARIRTNYSGIFKGCTRTLKKHKELFLKDRKMYFDYTSIAAVMAFRTGRFSEARNYLKNAIKIKPFEVKSYIRFIISYFPFLARRIYPNKK